MKRLPAFAPTTLLDWRDTASRLHEAASPWIERLRHPGGQAGAGGLAARAAHARPAWLQQAAAWRARFDERAPRERVLLIGAALAVTALLFDAVWLSPAWRGWTQARQERQQAQAALTSLQDTLASLQARGVQERQQLQAELQELRERHGEAATPRPPTPAARPGAPRRPRPGPDLARSAGGLVPAREMLPLLGALMRSHPGLKVRSLTSLGHTPLGATGPARSAPPGANPVPVARKAASGPAAPAEAGGPVIYRHGVELTLEGSYADLVGYLQAVEALPQRLLWGSLQLKVDDYPRVQMTVRLYTLSLDTRWVEI